MTPGSRRQQYVLAALVVLLVGIVVWRRAEGPAVPNDAVENGTAPPAGADAAAGAAGGRGAAGAPVVDLRLERLQATHNLQRAGSRNPFSFRARPAPAPATRPSERQPEVSPLPVGPPPIAPVPLKFIGIFDLRAGRLAILSDTRGSVFYGKEGDIIDGRYRLLAIGSESAELAYVDGRGRQSIRLSGQ